MTSDAVTLGERPDGKWQIQHQQYGTPDPVLTTVTVDPDNIHKTTGYNSTQIVVPGVIHLELSEGRRTSKEDNPPDLLRVLTGDTAPTPNTPIDVIQLHDTPGKDPTVSLQDYTIETTYSDEQRTGETPGITPIVTDAANDTQRTAARIDRRPLIRVSDREKYTKIVVSLAPTGHQFTPDAIHHLAALTNTHLADAVQSGEQRGEVYATVTQGRFEEFPARPRQTFVVSNLMIEHAHPLVSAIADYLSETPDAFCRYQHSTTDGHEGTFPAPGDSVPRAGASHPEPVTAVSGAGRHASLTNVSPSETASEYASRTAHRVARHIASDVTVGIDNAAGVITADESVNGYTATVVFDDGSPVTHSCDCPSKIDPCEHVAILLSNLPDYSTIYT